MDRIRLLKSLDALVGPMAVCLVKTLISPRRQRAETPSSILFIRPGGMGDAVLLIPAITAAIKRYPLARIEILAERRNAEVFSLCPGITRILSYDSPRELVQAMRAGYDMVIDTEQWYRLSAVVAFLTRAPARIGFDTNIRRHLFNLPVSYDVDEPEVMSVYRLLAPAFDAGPFDGKVPFLTLPPRVSGQAARRLGIPAGRRLVALFPGGSVPEKRWGLPSFRKTAERLVQSGHAVVVVGGRQDMKVGSEITEGLPESVNLCGALTLVETAAVLNEVSLLITGDSGIMHIAYGLGIKTLALFGPGNHKKWAPPGSRHVIISKKTDCSPCTKFGHTPPCRREMACMTGITPDDVIKKALTLLKD